MSSSNEKLSRREREIMNVIHAVGGRASAEDIRKELTDPPSYSAVRAMLVKLESKGQVRHDAEGLRYVYTPTTKRSTAQRRAIDQLKDIFFGGSSVSAVTALIKQEKWTSEELEELREQIDRVRAEKGEK